MTSVVGTAGAATTVVIDHFLTPAFPAGQTIIQNGIGTAQNLYTGGGPGLLGGSRFLSLVVTADEGTAARASANGSVLNKFVYENGSGGDSILEISYNGNGAGLGQNWSSLLELTFIVDQADLAATAIIELFADNNYAGPSYAVETTALPPIAFADTPYLVAFSSFETFGGFNFSDVDSIRITLEGPAGYDMTMHEISASDTLALVPEPGAVVPVAGLIAVGLLVVRRRRANSAVPAPAGIVGA